MELSDEHDISVALGLIFSLELAVIAGVHILVVMVVAIIGITVPVFVMASLMQYFLSVQLKWLPASGWGEPKNLIMPVIVLSFSTIATYARYIKSSMQDVLDQGYVLTARAKGLSEGKVIWCGTARLVRGQMLQLKSQEYVLAAQALGVSPMRIILRHMIPNTSWGALASNAQAQFMFYPFQLFFPAVMIAVTMLAFTMMGDGLRDAFDHRLRK